MAKKPSIDPQPARPDRIEQAPSALQIVVYDPAGELLFSQYARLRLFNSGSWGYHVAGKIGLPRVTGERLQISANLTVIGSKNWKDSEEEQ